MPRGYSLHIGVNHLDTNHYGSPPPLKYTHGDAQLMFEIAGRAGLTPLGLLLDRDATVERVTALIGDAAARTKSDQLFFITFSGHGSQLDNLNHDPESGGKDQTWCLWDRQLIDDELWRLWSRFPTGARILVFSDSCHSGTVFKMFPADPDDAENPSDAKSRVGRLGDRAAEWVEERLARSVKALAHSREVDVYQQNQALYDPILKLPYVQQPIGATVCQLSACDDSQLAKEDPKRGHGYLSGVIDDVLKAGLPPDYDTFFQEVIAGTLARTANDQEPQLNYYPPDTPLFHREVPFSV